MGKRKVLSLLEQAIEECRRNGMYALARVLSVESEPDEAPAAEPPPAAGEGQSPTP